MVKIKKIESIPTDDNLVLIGARESNFEGFFQNPEEKSYIRQLLSKDKDQLILNHYSHQVFIQVLDSNKNKNRAEILEALRNSAAKMLPEIRFHEIKKISLVHIDGSCEAVLTFAEGLALADYQFLKYMKEKDKKKSSLEEIRIVCPLASDVAISELSNLVEGVYLSRDMINEPASFLNAVQLASEVETIGKKAGFSVEVFSKIKIESLKMGGLLAVNKGSVDPPTFSILEYRHPQAKNKKPVVLVGKGIVYDTGGLSLKPTTDSMDYMKSDMSGAAAVAGVFYAVAKSRLPLNLVGLIPATDNRPDGNAYAPGDVIKMHDGTHVEVLNTDAEGRMILADSLSYAKQYNPELVICLATLTGSAAMAIGKYGIVGMGNASRQVMDMLIECGYNVHERIAEFPFWDDYAELMKSDIADLKNVGGKNAGAITAGKFLEHFTSYPFIHLDIAGPAFNKKTDSYRGKGGSGVGIRLLFDFLKKLCY
jgi:leucyl aminopeptidase